VRVGPAAGAGRAAYSLLRRRMSGSLGVLSADRHGRRQSGGGVVDL